MHAEWPIYSINRNICSNWFNVNINECKVEFMMKLFLFISFDILYSNISKIFLLLKILFKIKCWLSVEPWNNSLESKLSCFTLNEFIFWNWSLSTIDRICVSDEPNGKIIKIDFKFGKYLNG